MALKVRRIANLGHALPLDVAGPDGLGRAAPHMVDIGLSSSRALAMGWGLLKADGSASITAEAWSPEPEQRWASAGASSEAFDEDDRRADRGEPAFGGLRADIVSGLSPHVSPGVRDLIDRSLRNAGL